MNAVSTFLHRLRHDSRSLTIRLSVLFCLVSCVGDKPTWEQTKNTFRYNEGEGLASLDPALAGTRAAGWVTGQIFNGLVELDSQQRIVPSLAQSWSVDESGYEWTFVLRTDVWFHRDPCFGERQTRRLVADDVRYSIERICDARTKSTGLWAFRTRIDGAQEFFLASKKGQGGSIRGLNVVNDSVIRIRLTAPFAPFLAVMTMPYGYIVPHEAVRAYGVDFGRHPVGTGPFVVDTWVPDVRLRLVRNKHYFKTDATGRRLPYLGDVVVTFLRDPKNEFLEFVRGNLDAVFNVDASFAPAVFEANGKLRPPYDRFRVYRTSGQSIEYYGIQLDTTFPVAKSVPLASSRKIRQALNYAIDRHRIVTYLLYGRGIPARHGVLPPSIPGFSDTVRGYRFDPERARQLLAEAGYPNGKGIPKLLLQLGTSQRTASVAEAVQEMWRDIGVDVELRQIDFPRHLSMVRNGELALWRTSWIGDYPDPENFLALFISANRSPNGPNTTHFTSAAADSLYRLALQPRLSESERAALYHQMEHIVLEEAPWVFLYYDVILRLTQPNVHGFIVNGSDRLHLERVFKVGN